MRLRRAGPTTWLILAALAVPGPVPSAGAEPLPQDPGQAAAIRADLAAIHLPPGFHIALYALVPDARAMAVGPHRGEVFVGTGGSKVYTVVQVADAPVQVERLAPELRMKAPNGVCLSPDGTLYIVEQNRILALAGAEEAVDPVPLRTVAPSLIPADALSDNHDARVCRVGPDDKLYVTLGQPFNVPPAARLAEFSQWGIGGIIRMNRDGSGREVFARGIRNSVGLDFNPSGAGRGQLYFTDNQVDLMGDDIPPGEINRATAPGQNFGFPWYGGGHVRTHEYAGDPPPADVVFPIQEMVAHAADLGMTFYRGTMFPAEYRGAIFSAQHGSWNRSSPVGARVMVTFLRSDGSADHTQPFAEGWLDGDGSYRGRPVDIAERPDGSLLVSDDFAGAIYRISYDGR